MERYCPEHWEIWGQSEFGFSMLRIYESCMFISVLEERESPESNTLVKVPLGGLYKTEASLIDLMIWDSGLCF